MKAIKSYISFLPAAYLHIDLWIAPLAIAAMTLIAADNMAMAFTVPIFYVIFQCVVEYVGFGGLCRKNNCNFDYVKTSARAKKYFTSVFTVDMIQKAIWYLGICVMVFRKFDDMMLGMYGLGLFFIILECFLTRLISEMWWMFVIGGTTEIVYVLCVIFFYQFIVTYGIAFVIAAFIEAILVVYLCCRKVGKSYYA